uniref:EF-hand domain-containing protein n=1 Tax=Chromera velia CCMP2878 TaxID=1169474 RepID=A0A0G4GWW6_9ALVE|eukprot:Cvel_23704.t1-p1 / transcript=Cvel_23704.t1 / gene=Cvel_23704 / organism=Chromera_velia_CCMP2878 / gene_product=hypothetical protein / transcript_product=hypothetical protein / location=Cvel_scaffold2474:21896-26226(+) / protein_length=707 / sequence_SO=supercontig / SO=protein_coding / is_pseudo=false
MFTCCLPETGRDDHERDIEVTVEHPSTSPRNHRLGSISGASPSTRAGLNHFHSPPTQSRPEKYPADLLRQARRAFDEVAGGNGKIDIEEFRKGLVEHLQVNLSRMETSRTFHSLDKNHDGELDFDEFLEGLKTLHWLRCGVAGLEGKKEDPVFVVPESYDWDKTTDENYKHPDFDRQRVKNTKEPPPPVLFLPEYADFRSMLDYAHHTVHSTARQRWQDETVRLCVSRTREQPRPWVVYTCGPMGAGKGYVLAWLSDRNLFPLENVVKIDPDYFKSQMPEWQGYLDRGKDAGSMCHRESGMLQEIAQEVAMRSRQHVWVDGSLSDGQWFTHVFDDIRTRFPHYRIAIISVSASEHLVRQRIAERAKKTGRNVPESQIIRSLKSPENSIRILASRTDLVIRICNNETIKLLSVEDHSGNWQRGVGRHFSQLQQPEEFPSALPTQYVMRTSLTCEHLRLPTDTCALMKAGRSVQVDLLPETENGTDLPERNLVGLCSLRYLASQGVLMTTGFTCSPLGEITLDPHTREMADIPPEASHFSFIAPPEGARAAYEKPLLLSSCPRRRHFVDANRSGESDTALRSRTLSPEVAFALRGGFGYTGPGPEYKFLQINALTGVLGEGGKVIQFGEPEALEPSAFVALKKQKRFVSVEAPELRQKGAKQMAWVNPKECIAGSRRLGMHGGFAFVFGEGGKPHPNDRFFPAIGSGAD